MTIQGKMAMPNSQRYRCNLYLVNNVEDIVVILDSDNFIHVSLQFQIPLLSVFLVGHHLRNIFSNEHFWNIFLKRLKNEFDFQLKQQST